MPKYRRGSGSIWKRGSTFWIKYYVDGQPIRESAKTKDAGAARRFLNARLGEIAAGRFAGPAAERVTYDDLAAALIRDYEMNGKRSLYWVRIKIEKHLTPAFKGRRAHAITTAAVEDFKTARLAVRPRRPSNGEVNRELALLKRMFNLGIQTGRIYRKPHIAMLEERNARQGFFEAAHFEAVLAKLPDYLRAPITFAYHTGWRWRSEVMTLTWDQVDLEAGTVALLPGTTKNGEGRVIMLYSPLREILEAQRAQHEALYRSCRLVFHRDGSAIRSIRNAWASACLSAGVAGRIPHDLRRTAVRNMVRTQVPERVAMKLTGHKTRDVFERYNIVSEGDLRDAARRLGEAFERSMGTITGTERPQQEAEEQLKH